MGKEIERKFLVVNEDYKIDAEAHRIRQGYLSREPERTVRVRLDGDTGYLTIKGKAEGLARPEYEYPIPTGEAEELLDCLCLKPIIEKIRYKVEFAGRTWEVDQFFGENEGLVVAEIELDDETADFEKPEWVGREVTGDSKYLNSHLIERPFKQWTDEEIKE